MAHIAVIGAGAWGTTLSKVLADNGHTPTIWCHEAAIAETINTQHENTALLAGIKLPDSISATTNLATTVKASELILIVTASQYFKQTLIQLKPLLTNQLLLSATKGLHEADDKRMSEVITEVLPEQLFGILSGPNISWEIANKKPATTVIASANIATAQAIQAYFNNDYFRVYVNTDVIGTEYGGTLKNVIAIAAGIIDGLKLGDNTKAALMVRGMVEMTRLAVKLGAKPETLMGLTGMGDLITTCSSSLSRNHAVGEKLATGKTIHEILQEMKAVAEGVATTKAAYALAQKHQVEMPITEQMYLVLYKNKTIPEALHAIMTRSPKAEY